jgi:tetratricopeptide (TPR) repeat protein
LKLSLSGDTICAYAASAAAVAKGKNFMPHHTLLPLRLVGAMFAALLLVCAPPSPCRADGTSPGSRPPAALPLTFAASPAAFLPLAGSDTYFTLGAGGRLSSEWRLPFSPLALLSADVDYAFAPLKAGPSLSMLGLAAGAGVCLDLTEQLSVNARLSGGYFLGAITGAGTQPPGGGPYMSAGAGLSLFVSPWLSFGAEAGWLECFGLYHGLSAHLGGTYHLAGAAERPSLIFKARPASGGVQEDGGVILRVGEAKWNDVFPVFRKYYDDHPIGTVTLHNASAEPITALKASLLVGRYMDAPKSCPVPAELAPGQEVEVPLFALLTDNVLETTEATKASASIQLTYRSKGESYRQQKVETIRVLDRNAMSWDDDRRVCAFVTAKDPEVLAFSKSLAGEAKGAGGGSVSPNLRAAIAIHEALRLAQVRYVSDPKSPYGERTKGSVDFLQFPRQTLAYKAGDCDDLSILYAALLEAVGVECAFITVPGHIFMAASLDVDPASVSTVTRRPEDLIIRDGRTWVPIEVTERERGFLSAWEQGITEWKEASASGKEGFFPVHDGWKLFEPVGLPGAASAETAPDTARALKAFRDELGRYVEREISPAVAAITAELKAKGESASLRNRLGALYGRFGLLDKAEAEFTLALAREEYVPALVNLGNVLYLRKDVERAADLYDRAYRKAPNSAGALLGLARVNHDQQNFGLSTRMFGKLKAADPGLAERFAYLEGKGDEQSRAAAASQAREVMSWTD